MLRINTKPTLLVLCILDGWGIAKDNPGNAITRAPSTNFNNLWFSYPHTLLIANGTAVGLPEGQVGNSEVGHLNLGAGRIVFQDLLRINTAIADGTFYENEAFLNAIGHVKKNSSNIHLMGLIGLGAVHSDIEHLYALLRLFKKEGIPASRIKLHLFTDGRDSPPTSAKTYISHLQARLLEADLGLIASVSGRYYAMDRDNRWERIGKAYLAIVGHSEKKSTNVLDLIEKSYVEGITDEFIEPTVIADETGTPIGPVCENDAVIFFNYRPDRARQLTKAFVIDDLATVKTYSKEGTTLFSRGPKIKNLFFVSLTNYEKNLPVSMAAFKPEEIIMPIARIFSERNAKQLHIAETEKYGHVTYFFNGGKEAPYLGEDRVLVHSPQVSSYDKAPEMSASEVAKQLIARINSRAYSFIVANFANADMVGHTGNIQATIEAIRCVDYFIGIVAKTVITMGGCLIITSDHGNAEEVINFKTGEEDTEHNANPVPFIVIFQELMGVNVQLPQGLLADVAPTILGLLKIPKPSQMTGRSLL